MMTDFEQLKNEAQLLLFDSDEYRLVDEIFDITGHRYGYILDDFSIAWELFAEHPEYKPYTLVESDDGIMYIIDGWHIVNRFGYLAGMKQIEGVEAEWV